MDIEKMTPEERIKALGNCLRFSHRADAWGDLIEATQKRITAINDNPETMTYEEAAKYLKIAAGTLRQWVMTKKDDIPFHKVGRRVVFFKAELEEWIKRQ